MRCFSVFGFFRKVFLASSFSTAESWIHTVTEYIIMFLNCSKKPHLFNLSRKLLIFQFERLYLVIQTSQINVTLFDCFSEAYVVFCFFKLAFEFCKRILTRMMSRLFNR